MSQIDEIEYLIDLAKKCDSNIVQQSKQFAVDFPSASFEDYTKMFKKLANGDSYDKIAKAYKEHQYSIGVIEAKQEYKTVFTMKDCEEELISDLKRGKEKGSSTYIRDLDTSWTWRLGEFNIWTGYTNEGKSLFLRFIALVKALAEGWNFAFYAPEDFPAKEFFDDIIHTASGRSTDKDNPSVITEDLYRRLVKKFDKHFYFVYLRPPKNTLIDIYKEFNALIDSKNIKACIVDPLIKVGRPKEYMNADDKYAGYVTTLSTDFARQTNVSLHLVMHQLTPRLQENGLFPKPSYYAIKGGGTWGDGTDNVLSIQRPYYARDKENDEIEFTSQKIKKQKLVGIPQTVKFRFNRKTNRYVDYNTLKDLYDFNKDLEIKTMTLNFK